MSGLRWLWTGGPAEPTPQMALWLQQIDAAWWLESDLFVGAPNTLLVRPGGSKREPLRVQPGFTFMYDEQQHEFRLCPPVEPEPDTPDGPEPDTFVDAVEQACVQFKPERGFERPHRSPGYLRFTDTNGNLVQVLSSSAAARHCLTIHVEPPERDRQPRTTPSGIVHPAERPAVMGLCRGMVKELRDALNLMLAEPVADELACEHAIHPPDGTTYVVDSMGGHRWRARCACGLVVSGGQHTLGTWTYDDGEFAALITLRMSDPDNRAAAQHFNSCAAHRGQPPGRRTEVQYDLPPGRPDTWGDLCTTGKG